MTKWSALPGREERNAKYQSINDLCIAHAHQFFSRGPAQKFLVEVRLAHDYFGFVPSYMCLYRDGCMDVYTCVHDFALAFQFLEMTFEKAINWLSFWQGSAHLVEEVVDASINNGAH